MLSLQIQPTATNRPRRARSGAASTRRKSAVANEAHSYHPSLVNRIVAISSIDGTVNYTYGIGGNSAPELLRTADYSNAAIPDEVYNHDHNYNRILDSEHGSGFVYGPGNRLVSDGIYNYQYDHEGNMTRRTEIATGDYRVFDYDERNRLVALADYDFAGAALMTEQMSYDAFDRRISLQVDTAPGDGVEAAVTHFGYDGEDVIVDAVDPDGASGPAAAAVETTYLHGAGIDEVLAQEKAGMGTQWLLTDHLGSTRDIVDNSGSLLNHIVFSSFGGIVSQSNAALSSRYLYTQREFDAASGLNYYRARYYDSSVGRFLSEDPLFEQQGATIIPGRYHSIGSNKFAYALGNPTTNIDPNGLLPVVPNAVPKSRGSFNQTKDVSVIYSEFYKILRRSTELGERLPGPIANSLFKYSYNKTPDLSSCAGQSTAVRERLGIALSGKLDGTWTIIEKEVPITGFSVHTYLLAIPSNPSDPVLYLDPSAGLAFPAGINQQTISPVVKHR